MSKVVKLLEKCDEVSRRNYLKLVNLSFLGNFNELQNIPLFKEANNSELVQFIEICDNRLDRAKTFLNDIAVVFGFALVALSIMLTVEKDKVPFSVPDFSIIIIVTSLMLLLFVLLALLAHYRSQVHVWAAFKEKALLMKKPDNLDGLNGSKGLK
ncbi:MAG: hypothetical protein WA144_03910 [Candidatus Methanoperedens sp.]